MANVTTRDIEIFLTLGSGPQTLLQIQGELRKFVQRKDPRAVEGGAKVSRNMTLGALRKRICLLRKEGFISSRLYPGWVKGDNGGSLYALTEDALAVLRTQGFDSSRMRAFLPDKKLAAHELLVVEVIKAIKREIGKGFYRCSFEDEHMLRKSIMLRKRKKGIVFPDLHLSVSFDVDKDEVAKDLGMEVDNGTIAPAAIYDKCRKMFDHYKWFPCILCNSQERIEWLKRVFDEGIQGEMTLARSDSEREQIGKYYKVYWFATVGEFVTKGLLDTKWVNIQGILGKVIKPPSQSDKKNNKDKVLWIGKTT